MSVLVAAGLDPTGGAGLAADVEALLAVGARPLPVATALTVQGPGGALLFEPVRPALLVRQVRGLFPACAASPPRRGGRAPAAPDPRRPRAVKTGMLATGANARALARLFAVGEPLCGLPLVVDPVLAASSGLPLLRAGRGASPLDALEPLLAVAAVVTPNRPELAALCGVEEAALRRDADAVAAARRLPCRAVLVKGGHRRGAPVDLLVEGRSVLRIEGRRRRGTARGTGCRLASALAGLLARGADLAEAAAGAKSVVERYLDAVAAGGA